MDLSSTTSSVGGVEQNNWLGSTDGIQFAETETLDLSLFTPAVHYAGGWIKSGTPLARHATSKLLGPYLGTSDEVQTITQGGSGLTSYTLTFNGQTTASIAQAATAATVQAAIAALSNVGAGNVVVAGANGGPYTVTFAGALADTNVAQMTATPTGGTGTVTVATTLGGGADVDANLGVCEGFLYGGVPGKASGRVGCALLTRGKIREARLPLPVDANGKADLGARFRFI